MVKLTKNWMIEMRYTSRPVSKDDAKVWDISVRDLGNVVSMASEMRCGHAFWRIDYIDSDGKIDTVLEPLRKRGSK
jgi:hypothetical protein